MLIDFDKYLKCKKIGSSTESSSHGSDSARHSKRDAPKHKPPERNFPLGGFLLRLCENENVMPDEERWKKLVERLSGNCPPSDSFNRLIAAYCEPQRFYHTISHIKHCLSEFDEVKKSCESPDEVEFAIWLHDVVYDPHASDNEEMSAEVAWEILSDSSCPETKAKMVRELILLTKHNKTPSTTDEKLIVDIDLSILGQPPDIFDRYEKNIRAEYSWVSEDAYRSGRSEILHYFLDSTSIYSTDRFEKLYGEQARENIITSLRHWSNYP